LNVSVKGKLSTLFVRRKSFFKNQSYAWLIMAISLLYGVYYTTLKALALFQ